MGEDESMVVHIKHKGMEIWAYDVTLVCSACHLTTRVNGQDGIVDTNTAGGADV
jgi:hypothetical protein